MAVVWRNGGEKTAEGEYIVDIDPEDGTAVQTFRAPTRKEMSEKLAAAQFTGSRTINDLKKNRRADSAPAAPVVIKPMSADERMSAIRDLQDPAKFDHVISRAVESTLGRPLAEVKRITTKYDEDTQAAQIIAETQRFVATTADWYPSAANKVELANRIENNNLAYTANNLGIAWDAMKAEGKADLKPAGADDELEPDEQQQQQQQQRQEEVYLSERTRPRATSYSTGFRNGEVRTQRPPAAKPKYTKEDIEKMPPSVYEQKLKNEPGFEDAVNRALAPRTA